MDYEMVLDCLDYSTDIGMAVWVTETPLRTVKGRYNYSNNGAYFGMVD